MQILLYHNFKKHTKSPSIRNMDIDFKFILKKKKGNLDKFYFNFKKKTY